MGWKSSSWVSWLSWQCYLIKGQCLAMSWILRAACQDYIIHNSSTNCISSQSQIFLFKVASAIFALVNALALYIYVMHWWLDREFTCTCKGDTTIQCTIKTSPTESTPLSYHPDKKSDGNYRTIDIVFVHPCYYKDKGGSEFECKGHKFIYL